MYFSRHASSGYLFPLYTGLDLYVRCRRAINSIRLELLLNHTPWYRHQMETFSVLLALCEGNSPVTGEFPSQRPVARNFDVFFDLRLNKWLTVNNRDAGDLRRHRAHYDVIVLHFRHVIWTLLCLKLSRLFFSSAFLRGKRWIFLAKDQQCGKRSNAMASPWSSRSESAPFV